MGAVARGLFPASVVDTAGRTRFERVALLVVVLTAALAYANSLGVYREAADLALRQQRPSLAAALLDSARLAPTLTMKRP